MRLIDADALLNSTDKESVHAWEIALAPTIEAEPTRHGRWELSPFDGNWTCSICGNKPYHSNMKNMNYCPCCGAKMDEVRDDETD